MTQQNIDALNDQINVLQLQLDAMNKKAGGKSVRYAGIVLAKRATPSFAVVAKPQPIPLVLPPDVAEQIAAQNS